MLSIKRTQLLVALCITGIWASHLGLHARSFRVGQIPNGNVNRCANCHIRSSGGGPRTPFGEAVRNITGSRNMPFWTKALAEMDSDGDGFTNGEELGDPDGDLTPIPDAQVTLPGDANSFPDIIDPEPILTTLFITFNGDELELSWEHEGGVLEMAAHPNGPWSPIDGATSPHPIPAEGDRKFFRIRPTSQE